MNASTRAQQLRLPLMIAGGVAVFAVAAWFYLTGGRYQRTDDAYLQAATVAISASVAGRVTEVAVHDNQRVTAGDLLFRLDEAPLRIAADAAEARLAAARLEVQSLKANWRQHRSEVAAARQALAFQQGETARQERLLEENIVSRAATDRARQALDDARALLSSAEQRLSAVQAQLGGEPDLALDAHPAVRAAQAALDAARLDLSWATVRAPSDGVVTRVEALQVGAYVAVHAPVFALVTTQDMWVEANFKEDQLAHMQPGQLATVRIDSMPGRTFRARVASLSPGTGSQFSLLPPENATGNWVKVVQRVPVRIELSEPPGIVHAGLSASVSVDTRWQRHLFRAAAMDIPAGSSSMTASGSR